ncbi:MAG: porin [Gammaproteobacteria bacterium]
MLGSLLLAGAVEADETGELRERVETLEQRLEATVDMLESAAGEEATEYGHGGRGKTTIGGYGELHYRNLDNQNSGGDDIKEVDLHRVILFVGHEFDERIRFFSELEVEHAQVDGDGGEVAMEQAYLEFDLNDRLSSRAGLLLVPVGIINETHEPPTFYGVERNPVENKIIPSTWREGGVSLSGSWGQGLSYELMIHSGLEASSGSNYQIRKGRQSVREAPADDLAYTGRIKWVGMAGLEVAAVLQYQTDITQGTDPAAGSATLLETHVVWKRGPFGLRALYAGWNLDGSGPEALGADEQRGWYVEPAYKISSKVGLFARYNTWDNAAGGAGDSEYTQLDAGVNYWPHPDVVLKADYQNQDAPDGQDEFDGFNLGVGYQF